MTQYLVLIDQTVHGVLEGAAAHQLQADVLRAAQNGGGWVTLPQSQGDDELLVAPTTSILVAEWRPPAPEQPATLAEHLFPSFE